MIVSIILLCLNLVVLGFNVVLLFSAVESYKVIRDWQKSWQKELVDDDYDM